MSTWEKDGPMICVTRNGLGGKRSGPSRVYGQVQVLWVSELLGARAGVELSGAQAAPDMACFSVMLEKPYSFRG